MDLSGSTRTPRFPCVSAIFECHTISRVYQFEIVLSSLALREHIIGSWKELDNLTSHDNHHSSGIMRTYHTHFSVPLGIAPGW